MEESLWENYFIQLLNFLENNGRKDIREFKRSFESGSKQDRVYPYLTNIYEKCKTNMDGHFSDWFNLQSFIVKNGLKVITLKCEINKDLFEEYIKQLFSCWDKSIKYLIPEKKHKEGPPISQKKINKALKYLPAKKKEALTSLVGNLSNPENPPNSNNPTG